MASSSNSIAWMPAKGRHPVNIGSSLGRALKNRKNKGSPAAATKRSNLPERDFYCFKFNFKASSVDTSRPATVEIKKGAENNHITAEYPSTQPGEVHMFSGNEQPAKDVDCILIFDEETGTFTLEKLDSFVLLKFDRKQAASSRPDSPAPIAASSSSSSTKGKDKEEDYDMDRDVSGMDEDADGEADFEGVTAPSISYRQEEEEEEGEEIEIPLRQALPPKPQPSPPKAATRPVKPLPKSRTEASAPPPQPSKPKFPQPPPPVATPAPVAAPVVMPVKADAPAPAPPKSKPPPAKAKKAKPTTVTPSAPAPLASYASEEIIEFGRPAKRVRPSTPQQPPPLPAPAAPVALSLPGGSSSFAPPPAPASYGKPAAGYSSSHIGNSSAKQADPAPPEADSSDGEDWEQVPTATPTIPQASDSNFSHLTLEEENLLEEEIFGNGFGDADPDEEEGAEVSEMDPFDLEEPMEDEDFLSAALAPAPEQTRRPISLNELAGGTAAVDSDDEFSSSDDSEDD